MMRVLTSKLLRKLAKIFGSRIDDVHSGERLGNAFIIVWGGCIWVIGYTGNKPLLPTWLSENRVSYWRYRLGFTIHRDIHGDD